MVIYILFKVELMFRESECDLIGKVNIKKALMDEAVHLTKDFYIPTCHNLKTKLLSKFINVRLHFFCKKMNEKHKKHTHKRKNVELSSKSVAMRQLVQNIK